MSSTIEKIFRRFFDKYYKHQHPDAALRYVPVVGELKKRNLLESKILEVGSGSLGITPYLKREIDGLDTDFSGPKSAYLNKIKGSILSFPLRKNSYEVVISTDTLEHLKKEDRPAAIAQMCKAASNLVIIVVPIGKIAENQDKALNNYFQKVMGRADQFLQEHVENGLPQTDEILVAIDKIARSLGKKSLVTSKPLLNLKVREILMRTWISKNRYIYYLYLKGYLLGLPLLKIANFGNCYRRMFVIEFSS